MASVLHNKANIMFLDKFKSFDDVFGLGYVDRILHVRTDVAWGLSVCKWITAIVEWHWVHNRRRALFARKLSVVLREHC